MDKPPQRAGPGHNVRAQVRLCFAQGGWRLRCNLRRLLAANTFRQIVGNRSLNLTGTHNFAFEELLPQLGFNKHRGLAERLQASVRHTTVFVDSTVSVHPTTALEPEFRSHRHATTVLHGIRTDAKLLKLGCVSDDPAQDFNRNVKTPDSISQVATSRQRIARRSHSGMPYMFVPS
jgi:hypothetical protein